MGMFLQMAAVAASQETVRRALSGNTGDLAPQNIIPSSDNKTLVMFHDRANGISDVCKMISKNISAPTFYLHVHDDDLWMYEFYVDGKLIDRFNTVPDNWGDINEQEEMKWKGNADLIVQHWPGVSTDSIKRYLVNHSKDRIDPEDKAYTTDEFPFWDCWQIADFMAKLGVPYPDRPEDKTPSKSIQFRFDSNSLLLAGLGLYGLYAGLHLNGWLRPVGLIFAVLLLSSGILGFFTRKPAFIAGAILMLVVTGLSICQGITLGFNLRCIIAPLCGIWGAVYYINEYKQLKQGGKD